jgi:hypothetical protein
MRKLVTIMVAVGMAALSSSCGDDSSAVGTDSPATTAP